VVAIIGLEAETTSVSAQVCQVTRRVIYLSTYERQVRVSGIGEGVLGEGVQDPAGIFEEFECFVPSVDNGRDDLHVLRSIALQAEERERDGQVDVGGDGGGSRDGNYGGDEGDEGGTEGRGEHHDEGGEGAEGATPVTLRTEQTWLKWPSGPRRIVGGTAGANCHTGPWGHGNIVS